MNMVAFFHAHKFTHFTENPVEKTKDPKNLSAFEKGKTLLFGVNNPRPVNNKIPGQPYETIRLRSNKEIEGWRIKAENPKGTVIIFHGFSGEKSSMLDRSDEFLKLGFNTLLVDFMGSGGSEGNQTTIGYQEAEQVKTCFDLLDKEGEKNIYLFGTSMGSAAILKAVDAYKLSPKGIIIECPFGTMYETVCARFEIMDVPSFPMAGLLVFWGGLQNGFWAFNHNPTDYAKSVKCPTLLMYGKQDNKVSKKEIELIYSNLAGWKELKIYPEAGHEDYFLKYKEPWVLDVKSFLKATGKLKAAAKIKKITTAGVLE